MDSRTPFHTEHSAGGARFMNFGGWEMPLQFQGILAEHRAVRERAGLFDISHMGQIWITGTDAAAYLQHLVTAEVQAQPDGKGVYALLCREDGGVIDDWFIYRLARERFLIIANAARTSADLAWMQQRSSHFQVNIVHEQQVAGLALQGPKAEAILKEFSPAAARLRRHEVSVFSDLRTAEGEVVVARTGYTGEDGFELFGQAAHLLQTYSSLLREGAAHGLVPCGLGARDTLRLEMGYRLYGQDLDEQHTAVEAGLGWAVHFEKSDFIGREALEREKARGSRHRFIAFRLREKGIPRHGNVLYLSGVAVGEATSGTFAPTLQAGIGMGYVDAVAYPKSSIDAGVESKLAVGIHGRKVPADRVSLPFYRNSEKGSTS